MRIATWNISSGIDMSNFSGELFDKKKELTTDDKVFNLLATAIKENDLDLICLQEVITTPSFSYVEKLKNATNMKYCFQMEISPCHLVENTNFGLAILSKYPIELVKQDLFKNPNLIKKTEKGSYTSHDKGYQLVRLNLNGKSYYFSNTQMLPFHRFNANIIDHKDSFADFVKINKKYNAVLCGDFNAIEGVSKLKMLFSGLGKTYSYLFNEITTTDGKKCDNIIVPENIKVKSKVLKTEYNSSDHFMCMAEIE